MKVVVDASNVAHHVKNENRQPQMSNILAAVKALEESGDEFVIIADASLRHEIDDREGFERLLESDNVEEVPAGNDADHFILDIATREKAKVLSNDKFRDYAAEFRNISSMRIPFVIDNGRLTFGKPNKPKKDKPKESQDNESSGIKFIVEEDVDEKPVPKKETKKESKTSKYIDNIADYFNGLNQSKDYKSSNSDNIGSSNQKNDYKSSKKDKSKDNKSDVIYNKKTSNKSKKNKKNKKRPVPDLWP